jgi:ABC-type lipoprotein export system ATPase subunit
VADHEIALEANHLKKIYKRGSEDIIAIDDVSLNINKGEFFSFIGPPGSGKTTLINILGRLDNATAGSVKIGGEMQRVAIARALVNKPEILLADEPTGNLDTKRSDEIGVVLRTLNQKEGLTVLLVANNPVLAKVADRTIALRDGRIAS